MLFNMMTYSVVSNRVMFKRVVFNKVALYRLSSIELYYTYARWRSIVLCYNGGI